MSRYRISDDDKVYAREFKHNLEAGNHFHSPGLQRVLNVMRGGAKTGKYVLIVREPWKRWVLGRLPAERGTPVEVLDDHEFTSLPAAEWAVFKLRWRGHTGTELDL